jgi:hypothetical protein
MQMTSKQQIEANRANAKRSTGPRTIGGKARSSRNALSHGLSCSTSNYEPRIEEQAAITLLERTLSIDPSELVSVKRELSQIRRVRAEMLEAILQNLDVREANDLRGLRRYERAAFARQNRLLKAFVRNDRIANPTEIKNINLTRKRRSACEGRINATELLREEVSTRRVLKAETFCSSFLSWRTRSRRF